MIKSYFKSSQKTQFLLFEITNAEINAAIDKAKAQIIKLPTSKVAKEEVKEQKLPEIEPRPGHHHRSGSSKAVPE